MPKSSENIKFKMSTEQPTIEQEKKKPVRFKTSMGSVYEYLPDGRTQRFKTATNEQSEPQDTIVFVPPWDLIKEGAHRNYPKIFESIDNEGLYESLLLDYIHQPNHTIRITNREGKELTTSSQIQDTDRVYICCIDKDRPEDSFYLPVSKEPKVGYQTYDTTKYVGDDGETYRDKHLGNKVVEIEY